MKIVKKSKNCGRSLYLNVRKYKLSKEKNRCYSFSRICTSWIPRKFLRVNRRNFRETRRNFHETRRNFRKNFRRNFSELVGILGYCRYISSSQDFGFCSSFCSEVSHGQYCTYGPKTTLKMSGRFLALNLLF